VVSSKKKSRRCVGNDNDNGGIVINNDCVGNKVVVNINEGEDGGKRGWQ
jgi:hypothetical protein